MAPQLQLGSVSELSRAAKDSCFRLFTADLVPGQEAPSEAADAAAWLHEQGAITLGLGKCQDQSRGRDQG